ncbi:hemagglutinin repeat-containing protein [Pantoea sp. 18069]|uniref:two-partner secretion domain-containing protein n=1 Tax=Pantoea sp. 18069 TaxID=2681415 RepID=UPI00135A1B6F|nr:hemagglutinin repeat-containing protein [Pantoea sp. 18069]
MNQHFYRVIFNRARGLRMVVQETATGRHGAPSARGRSAVVAVCALLAAPGGLAQIIADPTAPGRERPMVLKSANGTPTVQIQTPSAAGVSRNRYQQFDIGQQGERGAILNNSRAAVQSQIGGWVPGNPWLAKGSARVIVNEVRSAAQSRLAGALEVAGQRADVIIANPSGLVVNGLSLINAAGVTLTTGAPRHGANGSLDGFSVRGGAIHLEGQGLDASQANYAQVLARAVTLNAGLWAQDLRVVTGANEIAADGQWQSGAANGAQHQPQFALDVAHLGGMYAHKITLVGTEAGLGVRNAGTLAATVGHLTLSANGQLSNTGVIASQGAGADLDLSAQGMANSGTLTSQRDTILTDGGKKTVNAGMIAAGRQLLAQAGQLNNQEAGTLTAQRLELTAARMVNAGQIAQTGQQALEINSFAVSNTGEKAVLGLPAPQAAAPAPADGAAPGQPAVATEALRRGRIYTTERLDNTGQLLANGATDVKAIRSFVNRAAANLRELHSEDLLDNRKGVLQLQRLTGAQMSVLNAEGSIFVATDLRLVARHIDNTHGALRSAQSLSAEARTVTNDAGTLSAAADLTLHAQQLENNRSAHLVSHGGNVRLIIAKTLNNQRARIAAGQGLHIESGTLNNRGGTLQTTGTRSPLHVNSSAGIDNSAGGLIQSSGDLQLFAATAPINNTGAAIVARRDLLIQSSGLVDNSQGRLQAGNALSVRDSGVAAGAALDKSTQTLSNQGGALFSANTLHIRNQAFTGAGRLDALGDLTLELANDLLPQGTMAANGKLRVETAGQLINQGQLLGGTGTEIVGTRIDNQHGAEISAGQNTTTVRASQDISNRGLIDGQDTRLDADAVNNIGTGRIYGDHLSIAAQRLENRLEHVADTTPIIAARQALDLGVPVVVNQGGATLQSLGDMRLGESLDADRRATGQGQRLDNIGAHVDAQGDMQLDMRDINNLNAGLEIASLADVENKAGEDLIALLGKEPESASLYREVQPGTFVPYSASKGGFIEKAGIPGSYSDGRMFKPVHPDKFLSTLPAAFIATETPSKYGEDFPKDIHLQLEPEGSARFAAFGIALPKNYTATAPAPWKFGALLNDAGGVEWNHGSDRKAFDAALVSYQESIEAAKQLNAAILAIVEKNNQTLDNSRIYTRISNVAQTVYRDRVTETKSARIEAGGGIRLTGQLNNVDSTVTAGQAIEGTKKPNNQATPGNEKTLTYGDAIRYQWEHSGGFHDRQRRHASQPTPYTHTAHTSFDLPTVVFKEYHPRGAAMPLDAHPNAGHHAQRPTPVVRTHDTESGQIARTLEAGAALPQSALYVLNPASANQPLVETDSAFTRGRQWTASDRMLEAFDPELLQKRLGDGFYEQQLVQQQVGQLTGRRFLGDYSSNDAQYQALLQSGATFAKAHGLRPGVALSAAQMAKLTSDMVWLVEQKLTLPDGSVQTVLAPQVYVLARPGDLDVQGGLISADEIVFDTDQDAYNSATIAGRRLVKITAHDINNVAGNISGQRIGLHARRDINVEGGTISATEALLAHADRDINAASTTRSTPDGKNTVVDQVAAFALLPEQSESPAAPGQGAGGSPAPSGLHLSAGRDINLQATQIWNAVEGSETSVVAKRNVHLGTVTTSYDHGVTWDPKNHLLLSGSKEVGTEIYTRGLTQILADQDISARAAQVQSTEHLEVKAVGSVRIGAGQATSSLDDAYFTRRSSLLSSSSTTAAHQTQATEALASNFGGKTVRIHSGEDIDITGSNVLSDMHTRLEAKRNISILAAPETSSQQSRHQSTRSGVFGSGGLGFTIGSQRQSTEQSVQRTASAPSTVGSLQGNVDIIPGNAYRQIGSNTFAPAGDINVLAKTIQITGSPETEQGSARSRFRQSGLSLSLSSPLIGMAQTASSLADAASKTSDGRMQALAAGAAALNVYTQQDALQGLATGEVKDLGLRLDLALGSSKSQSDSAWSRSTLRPSQVLAAGNVNLIATGAGEQSNLLIQDSDVHAGKVATLFADNRVSLLTTPETRSESGASSSRSAGLGLSLGATGPAIGASASAGKGRAHGEEQGHRKTRVTGGEGVNFHSGGDTVIREAVISGPKVSGYVGGDLKIESLQGTSRFDGRQSSLAGSGVLGFGHAAASAGYSTSRARGDFASTTEPSGIQSGDGGFDIEVKGNTDLKGGVIASTQAAIDHHRNRLETRTLTHGDIENRSDFEASGLNLSGGFTTSGQKQGQSTGSDTVTDPARWSSQNQGRPGAGAAAAGVSRDSASERSITRSGISPGQLTITDDAAQQAKTGQTAAEAVASINRDVRTGDPSPGLTRKWDGQRLIQEQAANAQIAASFGQQASRAIGQYAQQQMATAADLRQQAQLEPARAAELNAQAQGIEKNWGSEGVVRVLAHGVIGGLTGGTPGAAGAISGTLTVPLVANALRENDIPAPLVDVLTALASTAAGALTGGAAGASAAFNEATNNFLPHAERRLLYKSLKSCYAEGDISACETAAALNKKDQLSNRLLANAVATCKGSKCNEVSNHIQSQLHELGCPVPNVCKDAGPLYKYWAVTQSKAQGDTHIYPESWLLDAKAILDIGKFGVKILLQPSQAAGPVESLKALEQLTATKNIHRTGTRADIPTAFSTSKSELNTRVDDGLQYIQYQYSNTWIYPENSGFIGNTTKKILPIGTKLDRVGKPTGRFLAPAGTLYEARSLPPGSGGLPAYTYEVIKPLPVIEGRVSPAFGQAGGGLQIIPDLGIEANINWLMKNKYIRISE